MGAGRDPVDRVLDLVIAVPVSMVAAARQLMPVRVSRLEQRVARDLDLIVRYARRATPGRSRRCASVGSVAPVEPATADILDVADITEISEPVAAVAVVEPDEVVHTGVRPDDLPIEGYDQLSARQIVDRLGALTAAELSSIERHEQEHRRRQTILLRIAQLT